MQIFKRRLDFFNSSSKYDDRSQPYQEIEILPKRFSYSFFTSKEFNFEGTKK